VPRWPARGTLRAGQDGVAGAQPHLLGGPGRRYRRARAILPDVPTHQSGALRPAWAPPPPAAALAAGRKDWGGLDRRAADDGGRVRHDPEPRGPALPCRQGARSPNARDGSDTLRAFANGRKDDWDSHLPLAVFAINNAMSTLGGDLTPFFIDRGAHPRHLHTTRNGCGRWR
jgi:hypothetical protein